MHRIYCLIGRTASGKSTIAKYLADNYGMKVLKSYTTRKQRSEDDTDHTFISESDVEQYRDDMVAYTERVGYCSFATKNQLLENDLYIINPSGYYELILKTKGLDVELIPIYIKVPFLVNKARAKNRGDMKSWQENYDKENQEFADFEKSNILQYHVLNNENIDVVAEKAMRIIKKTGGKK